MVLPAVLPLNAPAALTTVSAGLAGIVVEVTDGGLVTGGLPPGGVPVTVALLLETPALTSAWVSVCVPVQVVVACGANVVATQTAATSNCASLITMPVKLTLPVLVTRNE